MSTFSLHDLYSVFVEYQAFVAHCAGIAKGVGTAETAALGPVERLKCAASGKYELSCSTIRPNDRCDWSFANYTGNVGLVLRPNMPTSITYASPRDAGSQIDAQNPLRRFTGLPVPTLPMIVEAISSRQADQYNEFGLINYSVIGVFVEPPIRFATSTGEEKLDPSDVVHAFPDLPVFQLLRGRLFRRDDGTLSNLSVDIAELYPLPS